MHKNFCRPAKSLLVALLLLPVAANAGVSRRSTSSRLPVESHNPNADEQTRLRVVWHRAHEKNGYLIMPGTLFLESKDGKSKKPIDWVQGVRVLISRKPKLRPDWSKGHDNDSNTAAADCVIFKNGSFAAEFVDFNRTVGRTEEFQVGLCLASKFVRTITWKNTVPVLPQTVATVPVVGPNPLNQTLQIINAAPSRNPNTFDPVALIRAVNHLHSLGKTKAIAALKDFLKIAKRRRESSCYYPKRDPTNIDTCDRGCVFLIVHLLFEPDPRHPSKEGDIEWQFPSFALHDDLPFLVRRPTSLVTGVATDPIAHVAWAEKHGMLRKRKLRPLDNPLDAVDTFLAFPKTKRQMDGGWFPTGSNGPVRRQAWRMIETVVGPPRSRDAFSAKRGYDAESDWQKHKAIAKSHQILWDATRQRYARRAKEEQQ